MVGVCLTWETLAIAKVFLFLLKIYPIIFGRLKYYAYLCINKLKHTNTMANFKPQVSFITKDSIREYRCFRKNRTNVNVYPTYAKLKASIGAILKASHDECAFVVRSRRGEWGEWFEYWELVNGKPKIVKEGWS